MARLNDDAQWIIMIGFVISMSIFFLALIINESTIVGQTTAEGVLEFPKQDIRDLNDEILATINRGVAEGDDYAGLETRINAIKGDIRDLSLIQKNTIITINPSSGGNNLNVVIHFNNGVTTYDETITY